MICQNCGNQVQPGATACPYCNMPLQQQPMYNQQPQQPVQPTPMYNQPPIQPMGQPMPMYNQQPVKTKHSILRIILAIIGAVVVIFIIFVIIGLVNSKKLSCKRDGETITIRYTDDDIIACSHIGGTGKCDLDSLQEYAKAQGVSSTISQLKSELAGQGFTCTE